jgi:SAM-dependent methyltransferase
MLMEISSQKAWSEYWRSGTYAACFDIDRDGYAGSIRAHWFEVFSALADRSVMLDIGTGNGAVPVMALQYADENKMCFDVHGVDLADIDPGRFVDQPVAGFERVKFLGCTDIGALPYADGSIDLVTSQFALEYMPLERALDEINRVLGSCGSLAALIHSTQSIPIQGSRLDLDDLNRMMDLDLLGSCRALLATEAQGNKFNPDCKSQTEYQNAKRDFARVAGQLLSGLNFTKPPAFVPRMLSLLGAAYQGRYDSQVALIGSQLDAVEAEMRVHSAQLKVMLDAAVDDVGIQQLKSMLHARGFCTIGVTPMHASELGGNIGYKLLAGRSS